MKIIFDDYKDFKDLEIDLFTKNIVGYVQYVDGSGDYIVRWNKLKYEQPTTDGMVINAYEFVTMDGDTYRYFTDGEEDDDRWYKHTTEFEDGELEDYWDQDYSVCCATIFTKVDLEKFQNEVFDEELKKKGVAASFQEEGSPNEDSKKTSFEFSKQDRLSIQNAFLVRDKIDLQSELDKVKKELEDTKKKLKESNDKLDKVSSDMIRLCTLMDGYGEMLNNQFIIHCMRPKHKDFIYHIMFKYSDLKD